MNEIASKMNKNNNLFFLEMSIFCIKTYPKQQRKTYKDRTFLNVNIPAMAHNLHAY